jgi:predicted GNAT family acetyltransferase
VADADPAPRPVDNAAESRFEVVVDGVRAELVYRRTGRRLVLIHTETPDELEGRGIGSALVRAAVDTAERADLTLVPRCPFARSWLEGHPEEAARVRIEWPAGESQRGS